MLISEAFDRFIAEVLEFENYKPKTAQNYKMALSSLTRSVTDKNIEELVLEDVRKWRLDMREKGNSPSTIAERISRLRMVLKFFRTSGHDLLDPELVRRPHIPVKPVSYLEPYEIAKLIDAATTPRDKALIGALFSTGCRISELLNLDIDDYKDGRATVKGKGDRYREVYFSSYSQHLIKVYLLSRMDNHPALFISDRTKRITISRVQQIVLAAAQKAKLEKHVYPHLFRHSYATDLMKKGANIRVVQELLGHKYITTTQRYTHVNDRDKQNAHKLYHSSPDNPGEY